MFFQGDKPEDQKPSWKEYFLALFCVLSCVFITQVRSAIMVKSILPFYFRPKMILSWLWILAWSPICSGQAGPTIRVEQVEGVKKVSVSIKEGTAVDTLLVDLTQLFSFPGVERQFSLQASALELIKVSDEGAVTLSKPVDYEELCQTNVKPCTFQSKVNHQTFLHFQPP